MKRKASLLAAVLAGGAVLAQVYLILPAGPLAEPDAAPAAIASVSPADQPAPSLRHRCKPSILHPCKRR